MIRIIEVASYTFSKEQDKKNQDSILSPMWAGKGILFAIADGVGSYQGGELASRTAIEYLSKISPDLNVASNIESIFHTVRELVRDLGNVDKIYAQAATTLTLGFIDDEKLHIGHVGDCRMYIKNSINRLVQITKDHTQLQQLVDEKLYTKKYLQDKKVKNILTTAIANNVEMKCDIFSIPLSEIQDGEANLSIYIMSDGSHKFWDIRPRFSSKTMGSVTRFASSLKRRIEFFTPVDDYSFVAVCINNA